jgi:D-3-phosphoglycerate dehydrogenase / 2-oxoglutarate reductase
MQRVLIIDDFHPLLMQVLQEAGMEVHYIPDYVPKESHDLPLRADILLLRSKLRIDAAWLDAHPSVKLIGRGGAGVDNIDEDACQARAVKLIHAGGANSDAVGEQAVGMLLSLLCRIHSSDAEVRRGLWLREENRGFELQGRQVGVLGYGHTGKAFARKLSGFGVQVLAYDKYLTDYGDEYAQQASLEEMMAVCEVLSLHIPLTAETRQWVNYDFLSAFSRLGWLLNLSRGEIVHTASVVAMLDNGLLKGFAADVLYREPPASMSAEDKKWFDRLVRMNNVVLTPHIGGWTRESYERIAAFLAQRVLLETGTLAKLPKSLLEYFKIWENLRPC